MTEPVSVYNPPVFPLQPQVPPTQTVCGYLNEVGTSILNTEPMNGQPMNSEFWMTRQEFCAAFRATTTNVHIGSLDILKYCGSHENRSDDPTISRSPPIWPRTYVLNSAQYAVPEVTYTFWAIKPLATAGKIRFEFTPDARFSMTDGHLLNTEQPAPTINNVDGVNVNFPLDSRQRKYVWEWDLKAKQLFSLTFKGNIPLGAMPTSTNMPKRNYLDNYLSPDSGNPFYMTTFGILSMYWQNVYIPGSIYPQDFTISVFKSLSGTKTFVQTGFRSGSFAYIR